MHEGKEGQSIDPVFANAFLKAYDPDWLRPFSTGKARFIDCGGKAELQRKFPQELKNCIAMGSDTTLIVLADLDTLETGDQLKKLYWETAKENGITQEMFEKAVFICPKYRIENWVQYLSTGNTDEEEEGPRVKNNNSKVRDMAQVLAKKCRQIQQTKVSLPPSLEWSCHNWRILVERM
ncbi:MAG: hypothetical protein LBI14_03795 [Treponema sp.]|jgi:hypothetical protein|nr:hypothetical protein [Treponema sp.]